MSSQHKLFNYKYLIAHKASNYPLLYSKITKILARNALHAGKNTNIVIDGFSRSANTYATYAFDIVQSERLNIAHHIHKKSQFLVARKYNIPSILLIRNPIDCIASCLIRQPKYTPATLFKGYYFLYNGVKNLDCFVIGEFENVLHNYFEIIQALNARFGTNFNLYIKNDENEAAVKKIIHNQDELIGAKDYKQRVAYPNAERQKNNAEVKTLLLKKKYDYLYKKCNEVYREIVEKDKLLTTVKHE